MAAGGSVSTTSDAPKLDVIAESVITTLGIGESDRVVALDMTTAGIAELEMSGLDFIPVAVDATSGRVGVAEDGKPGKVVSVSTGTEQL